MNYEHEMGESWSFPTICAAIALTIIRLWLKKAAQSSPGPVAMIVKYSLHIIGAVHSGFVPTGWSFSTPLARNVKNNQTDSHDKGAHSFITVLCGNDFMWSKGRMLGRRRHVGARTSFIAQHPVSTLTKFLRRKDQLLSNEVNWKDLVPNASCMSCSLTCMRV